MCKITFLIEIFPSSCVRIVCSDRSGMGKSLYIQRLAENLARNSNQPKLAIHITIPLHGPRVTPDTVLELFKDHFRNQSCCIYHIDIAPNVSKFCFMCMYIPITMDCLRFYLRWILFYSVCLYCVAYVIARGGYGGVIPISFMLWKSLNLAEIFKSLLNSKL